MKKKHLPFGRINKSEKFIRGLRRTKKGVKMETKYDKKYYSFLDGLRESGVTNMFGASTYLMLEFSELDSPTAVKVLADWMKTFEERPKQVVN